jgi:hypothetical protein
MWEKIWKKLNQPVTPLQVLVITALGIGVHTVIQARQDEVMGKLIADEFNRQRQG